MNKIETKKEAPKPTFKISFHTVSGGSSIIYRKDGLPFIIDRTDNAVKWLIDNGYKEKDIEIIGEKPVIWDDLFSPPKPIEPEPTLVEQVTEVLSPEPSLVTEQPPEPEILSSEPGLIV
jgi:hypothetical protein